MAETLSNEKRQETLQAHLIKAQNYLAELIESLNPVKRNLSEHEKSTYSDVVTQLKLIQNLLDSSLTHITNLEQNTLHSKKSLAKKLLEIKKANNNQRWNNIADYINANGIKPSKKSKNEFIKSLGTSLYTYLYKGISLGMTSIQSENIQGALINLDKNSKNRWDNVISYIKFFNYKPSHDSESEFERMSRSHFFQH